MRFSKGRNSSRRGKDEKGKKTFGASWTIGAGTLSVTGRQRKHQTPRSAKRDPVRNGKEGRMDKGVFDAPQEPTQAGTGYVRGWGEWDNIRLQQLYFTNPQVSGSGNNDKFSWQALNLLPLPPEPKSSISLGICGRKCFLA
jgi:hypothetical protein